MVRLENIHYTYPGAQAGTLQGISCALPENSFHFLTGPSGSGKTTLFNILTLNLRPTSGYMQLMHQNLRNLDDEQIAGIRRRMGIVFQDFRLLNTLSVRENVLLPLTLHGTPTSAQDKCVDDILDWVGLAHQRDATPDALSGGEKQRVCIARAVVNRPRLLIADEPTGNVDAAMGRKIMHLFCELHKHGTTVILATHDQNMIQTFQKSHNFGCLLLQNGRLLRRVRTGQSVTETVSTTAAKAA